ncbi:hypothetical protein A2671_01860 [Candidatus Kaiserbacteria bacterium RIFCSPHIGHO2_01_FULL_49_13]|uniref:Uncharacterized protein n=1 Tax=Candidatus Kaiserbacteria bacterium RIFCSPHIGHO2_01_FULL_49_13 TaxID=1798477 RepID=A0A1F6CDD9_9BACT|nr:MAG: hypothetical protein A2671_01860 [Candidatus Kaiserbacteria bacterium RIFCSPHIGHO2_01_FULL_49_13]
MNILNAAKLAGIGGGAALVPLLAIWWFVPEKGAGTKTTTAVSASPDEGVVLGIMVAVALMALIGILFALWRYGTPTLFRRSEKKKPPPEGGFFKRQWGQHKSKLPAPIAFASLLILCYLFFPDQFGWYWKRQELFWGTIIGLTIATWIFGLGGWAKITALAIVAVILAGNARQLAVGEWWGTLDTTKEYVRPQQPPPSTSSVMWERGTIWAPPGDDFAALDVGNRGRGCLDFSGPNLDGDDFEYKYVATNPQGYQTEKHRLDPGDRVRTFLVKSKIAGTAVPVRWEIRSGC